MRRTTIKTYISMTSSLLRELRNSPDIKLSEKVLNMQRLAATYRNLKDLSRDSEEMVALAKAIKEIKKDLEKQKDSGLELVKDG